MASSTLYVAKLNDGVFEWARKYETSVNINIASNNDNLYVGFSNSLEDTNFYDENDNIVNMSGLVPVTIARSVIAKLC